MPSSEVGATSWKRLAATWTSGSRPNLLLERLPVAVGRLVGADLGGDDRAVERHADRRHRGVDEVAIGVRQDAEPPAARPRLLERPGTSGNTAHDGRDAPSASRSSPTRPAARARAPSPRGTAAQARRARSPARARGTRRASRPPRPRRRSAPARAGCRRSSRRACRSSRRSPSAPRLDFTGGRQARTIPRTNRRALTLAGLAAGAALLLAAAEPARDQGGRHVPGRDDAGIVGNDRPSTPQLPSPVVPGSGLRTLRATQQAAARGRPSPARRASRGRPDRVPRWQGVHLHRPQGCTLLRRRDG